MKGETKRESPTDKANVSLTFAIKLKERERARILIRKRSISIKMSRVRSSSNLIITNKKITQPFKPARGQIKFKSIEQGKKKKKRLCGGVHTPRDHDRPKIDVCYQVLEYIVCRDRSLSLSFACFDLT